MCISQIAIADKEYLQHLAASYRQHWQYSFVGQDVILRPIVNRPAHRPPLP
jgi:hypothetical protein